MPINFFRKSPASPEKPEPVSLELVNVLLVDDDSEILSILKHCLESRHYVVTTVSNGVDGLKQVMAHDFDIILCDLMMPKMPGDMFFIAVERTKPLMAERFIFVTGHMENPKVEKFLGTVKSPIVKKPFLPEEIFRAIDKILKEATPLPL
jgi:CheY-like chemotaxis protein